MANPLSPVLVEITSAQRQMIMGLVHAEMNRMREVDPNSWTTFEYAQLENMAYALYVNCAE